MKSFVTGSGFTVFSESLSSEEISITYKNKKTVINILTVLKIVKMTIN